MEYQLNLGVWNSVFAVPRAIVDQHLKLAGAAQLKVILWVLRHAGEPFTVTAIAQALSMHEADVRDSMQYWIETGVVVRQEQTFLPAVSAEEQEQTDVLPQVISSAEEKKPLAVAQTIPAATEKESAETGKKRSLSRPEKPDMKYLNKRISEDESVAFLMRSADEIFGRMTSNNDKETLLLIHEHDGLPVDVLIMLLQYAFSIGKGNMRYIEKMAISWADDEILTLEAADQKIQQLSSGREASKRIQRIFGIDEHSPTEKESTLADLWINQWHFSDEMIREAYELCVNTKGKYILKYIGKILERWHEDGITDVSQIPQQPLEEKKKSKKKDSFAPAYSIEEYESTSVLDEEWDD